MSFTCVGYQGRQKEKKSSKLPLWGPPTLSGCPKWQSRVFYVSPRATNCKACATRLLLLWNSILWFFDIQNSKLAFRRTCCRRTSCLKALKTCHPKLQNVNLFGNFCFALFHPQDILSNWSRDSVVQWHERIEKKHRWHHTCRCIAPAYLFLIKYNLSFFCVEEEFS